ncbi:maltose alpha-D-glucosyltransferase/alpha-amylase [Lewinella marina]|uniref:maltose alpha-D-glucosyltransferase n=1 Tax=Neolewinella marina TaxID=438751 RepID=A0A2G0CDM9_9BACT|nr:maltose alpha-D-glucosyltransferase [Neolewinella marina]NJB85941.1 maltose alpha-D-glucosyltransferase/alpha-amylase [Neolewinella marina]PHK98086.1 maltose alpha-D-glucosyltransferase [Neolewinella marina]
MTTNYRREPLWYKDAIIYELNIKGFFDANGDGIGDFAGLEQKLDYLEELGVTAIWTLPFYPSPLRDDGYDISDYYNVSPPYGRMEDFKRFLDAAHARNLQVITELVINHTSDQHEWFQRARRAPKGSPERDYYVWSDTDEKYPDVRIIFTDTETSNWTWDPVAKQYYWHRFFHHQPDLNYDSPDVQREIFKVLDFWMSMGIDGFRLDAIPYLFEREGTNGENLPETHEFLKKLRKHVDDNYDNVLFLAEANMWPEESASYFGDGDECHMNYHFPLMPRMYMSIKMEDRHPITDIFDQTPAIPENCQWATFLRNHDELTLEMVTDEERDFMYNVYASDRTARINLGIRRRLAPLMDNDRKKIELLNVLLMSLPGTPVLYYGDEIGMGDNYYLGDRDGVRTPMQWNNNENAGFSEANPHSLYLPVIRDTEYSYRWVNVRRQQQNPNSLLNWTKKLLSKRKSFKVFGRGTIEWLKPDNGRILAFIREFEGERVVVVVNLSRHPQAVKLDLSEYEGSKVREAFGRTYFNEIGRDLYQVTLAGHGYYWLEIETSAGPLVDNRELSRATLRVDELKNFFNKSNLRALEHSVLPNYLRAVSWMGARAAQLDQVKIYDYRLQATSERHFGWMLLEVTFLEGLPELLQLPLAFHKYREDIDYKTQEEVLAIIDNGDRDVVLIDALYDEDYRRGLISGLKEYGEMKDFRFLAQESMASASRQDANMVHSGTEYMLLQSRDYNIKYYRRVDGNDVPDLEVKQMLNRRGYASAPNVLGTLHFTPTQRLNATLAIFEERRESEGNAWEYVLNNLRRFSEKIINRLQLNKDAEDAHPEEVNVTDTIRYKDMPSTIQDILGPSFVIKLAELGRATAAYHTVLADVDEPGFRREALSLHYQRSVYAGLKGDVRATIDLMKNVNGELEGEAAELAQELIDREKEVHKRLKRIYDHKIESDKIRIHGDFTLEQLIICDDKFMIQNFDGDPDRSYSQRRLRRSPAKDLANMMRSISYAAGLVYEEDAPGIRSETRNQLADWLQTASRYLCAEYLTSYRKATQGTRLLPADDRDLEVLLDTFRIEKALQELRYDLNYRRHQAAVPLRGLLELIE